MKKIGENIIKTFFFNYLVLNDSELVGEFVSEKFIGVGTGKFEIVNNKTEFLIGIKKQLDNLNGKLNFYIYNYKEVQCENIISSYCDLTIVYFDKVRKTMDTRLTTVFIKEGEAWKILNLHNSVPEIKQKRHEIFPIDWEIEIEKISNSEIYLLGKSKRGFFRIQDINYIAYSSATRTSMFHLKNSSNFEIKKNFSKVEEKLEHIEHFYKIDRGTIINLEAVEILDFKEERVIFKDKQIFYTSKIKLKELEEKWLSTKNSVATQV